MALEELLELLLTALRIWGRVEMVKSVIKDKTPTVEEKHPILKQVLRGATLILCRHLNSLQEKGSSSLPNKGIIEFVSSISEDFDKSRVTSDPKDMARTWMDATVSRYVTDIAPKWTDSLKGMIGDPLKRHTLRLMMDNYIDTIESSGEINSKWPTPIEKDPELTIHGVLARIKSDLAFDYWSSSFQNKSINAMHYLPVRMYNGWHEAQDSANRYFSNQSRQEGITVMPLLPLIPSSRRSYYQSTRKMPIAQFSQREMPLDAFLKAVAKDPETIQKMAGFFIKNKT